MPTPPPPPRPTKTDRKTVSKLEEATLKSAIYLSDSDCADTGDGGKEVSVALREATRLRP